MAANDLQDKVLSCPSRDKLTAFHLGKLADSDVDGMADHLDGCPRCRSVLGEVASVENSSLFHLRCSVEEAPPTVDPEYHQMEARARSIQLSPDATGTDLPARAPAAPREEQQPLPASLGAYQLLEKVGQGGMGTVYKAWHVRLKRPVALKMLPADRLNDSQAVARFNREMEAVGKLDHPNIIRATDAGDVAGVHFLVMEFVEGVDLAELVKRHGALPVADACELIRQAAVGLQYAHKHGQVHRDIKPSNLMVTPDGQVKVLDLGLALLHGEHHLAEELTGAGQVMGTVDFMAPEQGVDAHQVDIRADIYSLGCTLYKLLSGKAPFESPRYRTPLQKIVAHSRDPIPPVLGHRPDVPVGLVGILDRMLAKDRSQRFATPGEVAKLLQPFTAGSDLPRLVAAARGERLQDRGKADVHGPAGSLEATGSSRGEASTVESTPPAAPVPAVWPPRYRVLVAAGVLACAVAAATWFFASSLLNPTREGPDTQSPQGPPLTSTAPSEPHRPDPVKPPAPGSRPLDELEPHVLHRLLEQPPVPIGTNVDARMWRWDSGRQLVEVNGPDLVLLQMGTTSPSRFSLEVGIAQAPWTGNVGVFWGYHENPPAKVAKKTSQEFAWFQMMCIASERGPHGENKYSVERGKGTFFWNARGEATLKSFFASSHSLPTLFSGGKILVIEVNHQRLSRAMLGSVELSDLTSDAGNGPFASETHEGALGLISLGHRATFDNVRFMRLSIK